MTDMRVINPAVIEEFRRSGGTLSGELASLPVLLLTTTGRRSGTPRTTPLGFVVDVDRYVVVGSAGGSPRHPDWYRNLVAEPSAVVEIGRDTVLVSARLAFDDERTRLFDLAAGSLPGLADHAAASGRDVPVVVLTPRKTGAALLRSLHRRGAPLILVNAWDVASAKRVVAAGGAAVGTSSAAIAEVLGVPDDRRAPVDAMFAAVARIAGAVEVPVTADLLDGYGLPADELVERIANAGAVGCNIEDSDHVTGTGLVPVDAAATRIAEVRAASAAAGYDLVINARIDALLHSGPSAVDEVVTRARAYAAAGADCVFPVGPVDAGLAADLVRRLDVPLNAGAPNRAAVAAMTAAGVSRLSMGPMAFRTIYGGLDRFAGELLGTTDSEA